MSIMTIDVFAFHSGLQTDASGARQGETCTEVGGGGYCAGPTGMGESTTHTTQCNSKKLTHTYHKPLLHISMFMNCLVGGE